MLAILGTRARCLASTWYCAHAPYLLLRHRLARLHRFDRAVEVLARDGQVVARAAVSAVEGNEVGNQREAEGNTLKSSAGGGAFTSGVKAAPLMRHSG